MERALLIRLQVLLFMLMLFANSKVDSFALNHPRTKRYPDKSNNYFYLSFWLFNVELSDILINIS